MYKWVHGLQLKGIDAYISQSFESALGFAAERVAQLTPYFNLFDVI